jgi:hypothetical protein
VDLEIADSSTMAVAHGRDDFVLEVSLPFVHQALLFGRNNILRTDVAILAETVITATIKLFITTILKKGCQRQVRAGRPDCLAHPSAGADPDYHSRLRSGAAARRTDRRDPSRRCRLVPAR